MYFSNQKLYIVFPQTIFGVSHRDQTLLAPFLIHSYCIEINDPQIHTGQFE